MTILRRYAIEVVAAIGYVATVATALGLSRYHWVSVVLGVLSTVAVVLAKFFTVTRPAKAAAKQPAEAASSMTAAELTQAIRTRVEAHHDSSELLGATQWYVDENVIDCDAREFWKVTEEALAEALDSGKS